jgi:TRAP-type C4-dicarboxylate transport system permease small subunit
MPHMRKVVEALDRALAIAAGAIVVVLLVVVTAGIVSRGANRPLSWTDEAAGYLMVWLASFGWMLATRHHAHIRIRYFLEGLPRGGTVATARLLGIGEIIFGAVLTGAAYHLVRINADVETIALPVSAAWLYAPLLPAGFLTCLQAAFDLFASPAMQNLETRR